MPFTPGQLAIGANYQLDYFLKNDPIDQININHPLLDAMNKRRKNSVGGNEFEVVQLRFTNDSNYQNYFGASQVTYNEKDTVRQARFKWYNSHDGFGFDEDTLRANGIEVTDDSNTTASEAEKVQLTNRFGEAYETLKLGYQAGLDTELHLSGAQSSLAAPGLDLLVSTTPAAATAVGGIDPSTNTWWQNNANLGIAQADLINEMEITWRACTLYGGSTPDLILVGGDFLDAYRNAAGITINRQIFNGGNAMGGVSLDASVTKTYFKGVEIVWDPQMDLLDAIVGPIAEPWTKRCYFLNTKFLHLKSVNGHWMRRRKPPRVYDRYVHYWAMTSSYRFMISKRNAMAVLSVY
jgi:hypothetical protein